MAPHRRQPAGRTGGPGWSDASRRLALALAVWALAYACYRAYYAVGGTFGMIGVPRSESQFRFVNAVGAAVILLAAVLPPVLVRLRVSPWVVATIAWLVAVGCSMHAVVDGTLRMFSVTGLHPTRLPSSVWLSVDRRVADLQDLLLNEPWFLVEGVLWAALGLSVVGVRRRSAWLWSALAACLLLSVVGVLSGLGVVPTFHLG